MESRRQILNWHQQGKLKGELDSSLNTIRHSGEAWYRFISQFLLLTGALAAAAGVIFFFAFNWEAMGRLLKFALLESAMVLAVLLYSRLNSRRRSSSVTVLGMALLTGALLALTGQTYQTGADPWELFAVWAAMITPWAIMAQSSSLWLLWVSLVNLSLLLYLNTFRGLLGFLFRNEDWLWLFSGLNTLIMLGLEWISRPIIADKGVPYLANRIAAQLATLLAGCSVTWLAIWSILGDVSGFGLFVWIVWMAGCFYLYRYLMKDLVILSGWVLSGIIIASCLLGKLFENALDEGIFLLISFVIIGLSTAGGLWLKRLATESEAKTEAAQETSS